MERTRSTPPGPVLLLFVIAGLTVLVCLRYDWWPARFTSGQWWDGLIWAVGALITLAVCGVIWAFRTLYLVGRERRWSWWVVPVPAVVAATVVLTQLIQPQSFLDVRHEFEAVAAEMIAEDVVERSNVEIGPYDFYSVSRDDENSVYFMEAGGLGLTTTRGWVYSPDVVPHRFDEFDLVHIDGPWYRFTASF